MAIKSTVVPQLRVETQIETMDQFIDVTVFNYEFLIENLCEIFSETKLSNTYFTVKLAHLRNMLSGLGHEKAQTKRIRLDKSPIIAEFLTQLSTIIKEIVATYGRIDLQKYLRREGCHYQLQKLTESAAVESFIKSLFDSEFFTTNLKFIEELECLIHSRDLKRFASFNKEMYEFNVTNSLAFIEYNESKKQVGFSEFLESRKCDKRSINFFK